MEVLGISSPPGLASMKRADFTRSLRLGQHKAAILVLACSVAGAKGVLVRCHDQHGHVLSGLEGGRACGTPARKRQPSNFEPAVAALPDDNVRDAVCLHLRGHLLQFEPRLSVHGG